MKTTVLAALAAFTLTACTTTSPGGASEADTSDPYEGLNRNIYAFNNTLDEAVLEPVARGYRAATPGFFRDGVQNFLTNLRQPIVFTNSVLQGNPNASGDTLGRFLINSTVGVVGLFDVATTLGVAEHDEDFGQTLGVWGVEEGPYLMLPILGPSNVRDTIGLGTDRLFDPMTWTEFENDPDLDDQFAIGRTVIGGISARERAIEQIETLRAQPEPYIALRRNYTSQRQAAIRNGQIEADPYKDLPDFDDYEGSGNEESDVENQQE